MKTKLFIFAFIAALFCSCNDEGIGDASLIEGGWDLRTVDYDKTVYADLKGYTHVKDSAYTRTYEEKELAWLFYQGSISLWSYYVYEGTGHWSGYNSDSYSYYTTEGEGANLTIVVTTGSSIPGSGGLTTTRRYKVEKLTTKSMVISTVERMYNSDTQSPVDVNAVYTFKRENSLMDYIRSVYPND